MPGVRALPEEQRTSDGPATWQTIGVGAAVAAMARPLRGIGVQGSTGAMPPRKPQPLEILPSLWTLWARQAEQNFLIENFSGIVRLFLDVW